MPRKRPPAPARPVTRDERDAEFTAQIESQIARCRSKRVARFLRELLDGDAAEREELSGGESSGRSPARKKKPPNRNRTTPSESTRERNGT